MNDDNIHLRKVKADDIDLLFKWVNEKTVRNNAFHQEKISYKEHQKWFNKKLNSKKSHIYILLKNRNPIGQIRIDIDKKIGEIDYSIIKDERGNGYGTLLLNLLIDEIENNDLSIKKVIGEVKKTNKASEKAFLKADFKKIEKSNYNLFYYNIN
ncbi:GNAT family N-acetyltransferase [Halanaerobium kushneri]|jgi:RimJ/RimL family protein N-acetyltransferase|uniref:Protein N-acetyltransferase, RimJ/RimL family n=1 Tax=Halanaerobium kushneri TaxID=56779 RepID=A0A1N6RNN1_9FIRM|nr:GNAT family N-acetyltransferase [Halanaerobium kushneri]SIQ30342.1 Protein N-acetyltransferase, RimJ/RimL family [Halanaerobium kushneri]